MGMLRNSLRAALGTFGTVGTLAVAALVAPAAAGPVQEANAAYARGDYARVLAEIRRTTTSDWQELQAYVKRIGESLYGDVARDQLALIRPDVNQPVFGPAAQVAPRRSSLAAKADVTCRLAVSFDAAAARTTVRIWSMPYGRPIARVSLPFAALNVAVSQAYVAAAGADGVRIYDAGTGSLLRTVGTGEARKGDSVALYFSENGRELLALPALPGMLITHEGRRLFDVVAGVELAAPTPPPDIVPPTGGGPAEPTPDCPIAKQQVFVP